MEMKDFLSGAKKAMSEASDKLNKLAGEASDKITSAVTSETTFMVLNVTNKDDLELALNTLCENSKSVDVQGFDGATCIIKVTK
jgi:hypothetical protein